MHKVTIGVHTGAVVREIGWSNIGSSSVQRYVKVSYLAQYGFVFSKMGGRGISAESR